MRQSATGLDSNWPITNLYDREQAPQRFEQRQQHEFDEANLRRWFGHFFAIHERGDRQSFQFLHITLSKFKFNIMATVEFQIPIIGTIRDVSEFKFGEILINYE